MRGFRQKYLRATGGRTNMLQMTSVTIKEGNFKIWFNVVVCKYLVNIYAKFHAYMCFRSVFIWRNVMLPNFWATLYVHFYKSDFVSPCIFLSDYGRMGRRILFLGRSTLMSTLTSILIERERVRLRTFWLHNEVYNHFTHTPFIQRKWPKSEEGTEGTTSKYLRLQPLNISHINRCKQMKYRKPNKLLTKQLFVPANNTKNSL